MAEMTLGANLPAVSFDNTFRNEESQAQATPIWIHL